MPTVTQRGELAIMWIAELLTGTYKQNKGSLGDVDKGFCCLGVANYVCDLRETNVDGLVHTRSEIGLRHDTGLSSGLGSFKKSLVTLNDVHDITLDKIGEVLAQYPHNYFEEEVAEYIEEHIEDELLDRGIEL